MIFIKDRVINLDSNLPVPLNPAHAPKTVIRSGKEYQWKIKEIKSLLLKINAIIQWLNDEDTD